jgi:hypothetical protein
VVLDQVFCQSAGAPEPKQPNACAVVFAHAGHFLVFDGALAHGVLESCCQEDRMTILINWWAERPAVRFRKGFQHHVLLACMRCDWTDATGVTSMLKLDKQRVFTRAGLTLI